MLQAALFELEGVLVDTHAMRREALCRALADDGVHLVPDRFDAWCAGLPVERAVVEAVRRLAAEQPSAAALDDTGRELVALRAERAVAGRLAAGGASLTPGARATLDALAGTMRLALVTRARRREVDAVLALSGLEAHFSLVVTADDVRSPKPAPDGHRAALARLARYDVAASGVVAFEDARPGIDAARAAAVRVVLVGAAADADTRTVDGAAARLSSIAGLTPRSLAALLDLAPALT